MPSPSIMDSLFQRTLDDLIKGIRLHVSDSSGAVTFISKSVDEIRRELKSTDLNTKSVALQKLTYLRSLHGVEAPPSAAFAAVELSSSPRFHHKKAAYLAASLSFHPSLDVLLLLTNQLRKDLSSPNPAEVSLALEFLSTIASHDLSRDLTPEIFTLLSSTKLFIRRKALAAVLSVFKVYPDAVRVCFKRLVENLDSSDLGTVSVTVSVFCDLTMIDPKSYFPLAPEFYKILVDSRNNWVLIKILKIFAKLAPLEPRLAKRIVDPICEHMRRTVAKSLVFECIRTVATSLAEYDFAVRLAMEKVREFLVDEDSNLKYLGLQALSLLGPMHLWAVEQYKPVIIRSLSDSDPNVKLEALHLLMVMVSEDNVAEICRVLVHYALKSDPGFCNEILGSILSTCSRNFYGIIIDFEWYVSLLGEISRIPHCQRGEEIENQLIDIGIRVKDVRPELVRVGRDLVIDPALLGNPFLHRTLSAAAWLSGEYVEFSKNPIEVIEALLQPRTDLLPPSIRAVYIHSAFKVLVFCLYSYFFPEESVPSSHLLGNNLEIGVEDSVSERDCQTNSNVAVPNEDFNPRISSQSVEGVHVENDRKMVASPGTSSLSVSVKNELFSHGSIIYLLDNVKSALCPLIGSHEVEIQERARNVLGLIELVEQEFSDSRTNKEDKFVEEESKASEIVSVMHSAFSEELGLVSMTAQERVPIPDGLVLADNLNEVEAICADIELPTSNSFSLIKPQFVEKATASSFSYQNEDQLEPASESTSLLTEHRKRHGLYYLPSDTKQTASYDYPPANELKLTGSVSGSVDDLVKLTEQSLAVKKKSNQMKPRPNVVRLEGDDELHTSAKKLVPKDDSISSVVQNVLLGNEAIDTTKQAKSSDKSSSSKKRGKQKVTFVHHAESRGKLDSGDNAEVGTIPRKGKRHLHGREKKSKSLEEKGEKGKRRSGHAQGKSKARQRAEGGMDMEVQTPVIPDFLL